VLMSASWVLKVFQSPFLGNFCHAGMIIPLRKDRPVGKEVTIPLKDLRTLVKLFYGCSVSLQAQRLVRKKQPKAKHAIVQQYLSAVAAMVPSAEEREKVHFGELLASLRSGQDVPASLANFLSRAAKSPTPSQTKARPPK